MRVSGRRTSYSDSPSIFAIITLRTARRSPSRYSFANSSITGTSFAPEARLSNREPEIAAFDLTFRALKSVSLAFAPGSTEMTAEITAAHDGPVDDALGNRAGHVDFVQ